MKLSTKRSVEWVNRLPSVLVAINNEETRMIGMEPSEAIKKKVVQSSVKKNMTKEKPIPAGTIVRYLYEPGELEGGRRRATDPVWSLKLYRLGRYVIKPNQPILYYLQDVEGAATRGFVKEELLIVPPDTQLPQK